MTSANPRHVMRVLCYLFLLDAASMASQIAPQTFSVPGPAEGNLNSSAPFGLGSPYFRSYVNGQPGEPLLTGRYQQVYAAAAFNGIKDIAGIAFRQDGSNAPTGGFSQLNDVFVTLSVTSKAVGNMDTVFANNLTGPTTTVYSGPLRFNWQASAGTARPFDLRIPFQRPFRYDPSLGNLLLDVTVIAGNTGGSSLIALDAAADSHFMSQVSVESSSPTGWRDATGAARNVGLVTQFMTVGLPEQTRAPPTAAGVARPGAGVSPPTILSKVEPQYSDEARAARYQGTVVLEVIVRADGTADVTRVVRALGLGLDEAATQAVKQWRFRPGTRNGQPVDVLLNIEVSFNLK